MTAIPARRGHRRPWAAGTILTLVLIGTLLPMYWLVTSSLKPSTEISEIPATLFPHSLTFDNFRQVWSAGEIPSASARSLGIALVTTACVVVLASMSAYAATHLRYRFSSHMLTMGFVTQLLPQAATLVPVFILWTSLGLVGSLPGLTLAYIGFQLPVAVWIITGHFASVPTEVVEAASVDGSKPLRTLFRIVVPMAAPGIAAVAIWAVIGCWSELMFALILLSSDTQTVPVALAGMVGQHTTDWGLVLAASTIAALPPLILFFLLQKYFANGISGAVKG
ncbi:MULTISPECIES: carbohydrate ABC transporter permease [unclassified Isoptericola]|uniref:carbohydrate ABC transporter permease n=1 Tax=unclassified Isoptericola TaxID=2623355 RepID=UPI00365DCE34